MSTTERKQREFEAREAKILEVSKTMLAQHGYFGLNMDRIAAQMAYSKGTIYQHFKCKEEVLLALAVETVEKRTEMFNRAATFQGRPRARMAAIGTACEMFMRRFPEHFEVEKILGSASILEKTTEKRQTERINCEKNCMSLVSGIIRDAIAQGDLISDTPDFPEQIVFGLWSMQFGGFSIMGGHKNDGRFGA